MKLPDKIGSYQLRKLTLNEFSVVEYSKTPTFFRYFQGNEIDENDLLYEVRSKSIEEAEIMMINKLKLIEFCRNEFKKETLLENNPTLDFVDKKTKQLILLKSFTAFYIWDIEKNSRSIAIISLNIEEEIDLIIQWIELSKKFDIRKNIRLAGEDFDTNDLVFTNILYLFINESEIKREKLRSKFKQENIILKMRDDTYREDLKPDFFICHDSRDKDEVARPLFENLKSKGLKVWYDEYSLEIGDSLTEAIQDGIKNCKKAIVIVSPNFISNEKWIRYELQSLLVKQITNNEKIILPIWHNVDENDLKEESYYLLDKLAGNTNNGIDALANKLHRLK